MNAVQTLFSGLACCSNLQEQQEIKGQDDKEASFLITCFDEHDMELRDIKIHPTTTWAEMQICITDALGGQAMFAYDDGTAVDLPVRNEKEFQAFLDMLKNDQSINGEYDILLLPAGQWNRYDEKQKHAAAEGKLPTSDRADKNKDAVVNNASDKSAGGDGGGKQAEELGREETGEACSVVANMAGSNLLSADDEKKVYDLIAVSHRGVVKAYRQYQQSKDMDQLATALKRCL
mmetsp:Transcript_38773/g.91559  ORF Transcript_38773/g.91559 Transcript_38773/m.91559 type:complete len:233 (-) Transcript_38773:249-947(-)